MDLCLKVDWSKRTVCLTERPVVRFLLMLGNFKVEGEHMNVTLNDTQKVKASITLVDVKGNPAQVDGVPVWESSNEELLSVTPEADGMSATISAVGALGTGQVKVGADADLGAGTTQLVGVLDVDVIASEATAISFAVSTPEPA